MHLAVTGRGVLADWLTKSRAKWVADEGVFLGLGPEIQGYAQKGVRLG